MFLNFIHVVACIGISSLIVLSLSIHQLNVWVFLTFWLLRIMLLYVFTHKSLCGYTLDFSCRSGIPGSRIYLFHTDIYYTRCTQRGAKAPTISPSHQRRVSFAAPLSPHPHLLLCVSVILAIVERVKWCVITVLWHFSSC